MAVDVKTLTIGSHILVNGKRAKVISVESTGIVGCRTDVDWLRVMADDIKPIGITPEILTEMGFKYHEYDNGKLWEWDLPDGYKDYGYLEFDEETTTIWRGRLWSMKEIEVEFKVEYLHDLENIFYMFYGVELIEE